MSEAILWVQVGVVPKDDYGWRSGGNRRFDAEFEGEAGEYVDLFSLDDDECKLIGIDPNPAAHLFETDDPHQLDFATLSLMDDGDRRGSNITELVQEKFSIEEIEEVRILKVKYDEWREQVKISQELPKIEILKAIINGDVMAYCRNSILIGNINKYESEDYSDFHKKYIYSDTDEEFVSAPISIFRASNIDWQFSRSEISNLTYQDICVDTASLMEAIPRKEMPYLAVRVVGDVLIPSEESEIPKGSSARGRPSLPWDEMHREIGRMMERGTLPDKKEALIAELMAWCQSNWGKSVSRSAIQSQLRNIGDARK